MISTVLVPGAAGPAGINTIKSLRMANFYGKIVATDSSSLSAGFFLADTKEITPEAAELSFTERLLNIVKMHKVDVLMPSSGYDIYRYSENREKLAEIGAQAVVTDRNNLETCRDKFLTYKNLSNKFELPFTTTNPQHVPAFPIIAKPQFEKGIGNIIKIDDESDLNYVNSKFDNMIFQEFLPGTEYTVDVLSDLNKKPLIAVPRIRLQTKGGVSTIGKIVRNPDMEINCMKMAEYVGIRGPCCIQMKESSDGVLKLVEINARMGGGTIFTTLAGANFPAMILDMIDGKEISMPKIAEITIIRYYEEIVIN